MPNTKLLWVDDQITGLTAYVTALKTAGFDVATADKTDEATEIAKQMQFELFLVDIRMPPPDGIECLRRLHKLQPNAKMATLSGYHYLHKYLTQLRNLDFPVELIDKDFPDTMAKDFGDRFLNPIRDLASKGVTNTIEKQDELLSEDKRNPFDIPLAEFQKLPLVVKDQLRTRAGKKAAEVLKRAFAEGKIWVMLCGSSEQVRASATTPERVLSEEKMMEFARSQQRAPFQFYKPITVDDGWSSCGESVQTRYYPTITLELNRNQVRVHFDTGCPMTLFSYEELLRLEKVRPTTNFAEAFRNGAFASYWATPLEIQAELRCQRTNQTQKSSYGAKQCESGNLPLLNVYVTNRVLPKTLLHVWLVVYVQIALASLEGIYFSKTQS